MSNSYQILRPLRTCPFIQVLCPEPGQSAEWIRISAPRAQPLTSGLGTSKPDDSLVGSRLQSVEPRQDIGAAGGRENPDHLALRFAARRQPPPSHQLLRAGRVSEAAITPATELMVPPDGLEPPTL